MKSPVFIRLSRDYAAALRDYLHEKGEEPLRRAYELGREAIEDGLGVLDIAAIHSDALARLLSTSSPADSARVTRQAATFLAETLSRAEMLLRGFQDALKELGDSHERLRLSERMAAIGTLSAGLGHDMGNLLLPVRVRLESIERADLAPRIREDLSTIRTCMEHLQHLANGLRLLALNPDESRNPDEVTVVYDWWTEVSSLFKNSLPRGVALKNELEAGLPPIRLARHLLTQAVFNLVQNAGDAMRAQSDGVVTVKVEASTDDRFVRVIVADNGPGMTAEVRQRCLEPFFTTKTRTISTGLGLALVHSIVQKAKGKVEIQSEPGAGTAFTLHLPAAGEVPTYMTDDSQRERLRGLVTLKDARLRAYVNSSLESLGCGLASEPDRDAPLWVTDVQSGTPEAIHEFLDEHPRRRVVVLGAGEIGAPDHRVIQISDLSRISSIRQTLQEAVMACAGREKVQRGEHAV